MGPKSVPPTEICPSGHEEWPLFVVEGPDETWEPSPWTGGLRALPSGPRPVRYRRSRRITEGVQLSFDPLIEESKP